jgi:hypothetical protein
VTQHDIDCEQALRKLFDFIDYELGDDERDAMQRHISTCRSCSSAMSMPTARPAAPPKDACQAEGWLDRDNGHGIAQPASADAQASRMPVSVCLS